MSTSATKTSLFTWTLGKQILTGFIAVLALLVILGLTTILNFNKIGGAGDDLIEATEVERLSHLAVTNVKNYLLDNDPAIEKLVYEHLNAILTVMDKVESSGNQELIPKARIARQATKAYLTSFTNIVETLRENEISIRSMINNGLKVAQIAEDQYRREVSSSALGIWVTALAIMRHEKEERLHTNRANYQAMQELRVSLETYFEMLEAENKHSRVREARHATRIYFAAVDSWIENDNQLKELISTMAGQAQEVINQSMGAAEYAKSIMQETQIESRRTLILGVLITILLGLGAGIVLARIISRPLIDGVHFAQAIAAGDLSQRIAAKHLNRKDEIGQLARALDEMVTSLSSLVSNIKDSIHSISIASSEIAAGNTDLSQRTEEQASSLEQTAASLEELTATVRQNTESAQQSNQLTLKANEEAVAGGAKVRETITKMDELSASSAKMNEIISVIDSIAFQTNILALNAAVEAARAGEQGRGFAVVASEVRTLAQRSASAAREIQDLIKLDGTIVQATSQMVHASGQSMEEIIRSIQRVADLMNEISAASHEQSQGIEQVNQAVMQMDGVTQQNAALVEEAAAAAESLEEQVDALDQAVAVFQLTATAKTTTKSLKAKLAQPATPTAEKGTNLKANSAKPAPTTKRNLPAPAKSNSDDDWEEF